MTVVVGGEGYLVQIARTWGAGLGLPELRRTELPSADLEVRLWSGFGLVGTDALRLRRAGGRWSAERIVESPNHCFTRLPLPDTTAWGKRWRRALAAGLDRLPNTPPRTDAVVDDGHSFVLEWREGKHFRALSYDNPAIFATPADQRFREIARDLWAAGGLPVPE